MGGAVKALILKRFPPRLRSRTPTLRRTAFFVFPAAEMPVSISLPTEQMREALMTASASRQIALWFFTCASFAYLGAVVFGLL